MNAHFKKTKKLVQGTGQNRYLKEYPKALQFTKSFQILQLIMFKKEL